MKKEKKKKKKKKKHIENARTLSEGKIIVTIDADSMMTKYSLQEIKDMLESGNFSDFKLEFGIIDTRVCL